VRPAGAALAAAALLALFCSNVAASRIERLIFHPVPGAVLEPADVGLAGEDAFFDTEDGVRVHGFFLSAPGATRALLLFHGNAENASHGLPFAAELVRRGAHVLVADYRGYGRSEGRPSEAGVYADARAALRHLVETRGVPARRVVVYGRSLGGAVAVDLAQGRDVAGLVLESTFTSIADVGRAHFGLFGLLAGRRFESAAKIRNVRCPLLFVHGERDEVVPLALGRRLFEAAPGPKSFEAVAGAGHNDLAHVAGLAWLERIGHFLDQVAP
jgi:fermentation-respiration switch protein FrsA (DUF1100 family)